MSRRRHGQAHLTAEMRAALATRLLQRKGDMRAILLEEGTGVVEALKAIRGPLNVMRKAARTASGETISMGATGAAGWSKRRAPGTICRAWRTLNSPTKKRQP